MSNEPGAASAIVAGAGIVGICAALELATRGFEVQVVDRDPPADGASYGNAGVICNWSCSPTSVPGVLRSVPKWLLDPDGPVRVRAMYLPRMLPWLWEFVKAGRPKRLQAIADAMFTINQPSLDMFQTWLADDGDSSLIVPSDYVHVYRSAEKASLNQTEWRLRLERGATIDVLDSDPLHEMEPDLSPEYTHAVVVRGQGRAVNPGRLGKALARKAEGKGVRFSRAEMKRVRPRDGGGAILDTDNGALEADKVVVCAGAWSNRLLEGLGLRIPLEAERGYHALFSDPGVTLNNTVHDGEGKYALNSMEMGLRCAGTAEFAGIDAAPDYQRARRFARLAKRVVPQLNVESMDLWMGRRPSLPDSVPCIGPLPQHPDIIVGFGHGHLGLTGAPMTGRIVAAVAAHERLNIDLTPYRVDRFPS